MFIDYFFQERGRDGGRKSKRGREGMEGEMERQTEREWSVISHMCPDQESDLQHFGAQDDAPPRQGSKERLFII